MAKGDRFLRLFAADIGLQVYESSRVTQGVHCWVFQHDPGLDKQHIHLSVQQAKLVILGLEQFVKEAEAGTLAEPTIFCGICAEPATMFSADLQIYLCGKVSCVDASPAPTGTTFSSPGIRLPKKGG